MSKPNGTGPNQQPAIQPSTIDSGFILSLPRLLNPATSDSAYQRVLAWYLPPAVLDVLLPRLEKFGEEAVSDGVHEWIANAESQPPYVKLRNVWGERYPHDRLVTSEGWKRLGEWGIKNGLVIATPSTEYHREYANVDVVSLRWGMKTSLDLIVE